MASSSPVSNWITAAFQQNVPPEQDYSKAKHKRDGVFLLALLQRIANGQYTYLSAEFTALDFFQARAISTCLDPKKQEKFSTRAAEMLNGEREPGGFYERI